MRLIRKTLKYLALLFLLLTFYSCSWRPVKHFQVLEELPQLSARRSDRAICGGSQHYIPWNGETGINPVRIIRINIHFMNSRDGRMNLKGQAAIDFALDLIKSSNNDLQHNQPMRLPLNNSTQVLAPLIQYRLVSKKDGSPAIYEHFDDKFYFLVKKGSHKNNYDRTVIDRFGINQDSILNVFIQVPPPDSLMNDDYGGLKTGVALRNGIRISGPLLTDSRAWSYAGMFNHEVGHILGLRHSWVRDQCDDTPEHPNCWNFTHDGSVCDSLVSNNVMDSNADQNAFTPCQIGIMRRSLAEHKRPQRQFIDFDLCKRMNMEPIRIRDSVIWCRETDVVTDVIIENRGHLVISNRISMAQDSRIYIEHGGQLILLKSASLVSACGFYWDGIYSRKPTESQVLMEQGAEIITTHGP